jgi:hypothetical protein
LPPASNPPRSKLAVSSVDGGSWLMKLDKNDVSANLFLTIGETWNG